MSNTAPELTAELMIQSAKEVIHEMKQSGLLETFLADESMRNEIIEVCLLEVARKWAKIAVMVRTDPAFMRYMLDVVRA